MAAQSRATVVWAVRQACVVTPRRLAWAPRRWMSDVTTGSPHAHPMTPSHVGRRRAPTGDDRVPRTAAMLGAAGLLPFVWYAAQHERWSEAGVPRGDRVIAAVGSGLGLPLDWARAGDQLTVRRRLITYGATILSFLGAVHWGIAMAAPVPPPRVFVASVVPSLLAWVACCMDDKSLVPHVTLAAGFIGVYLYDEAALIAKRVPPWYTYLRTPLTVAVLGSLVGGASVARDKSGV